jgi:hypothetical protein
MMNQHVKEMLMVIVIITLTNIAVATVVSRVTTDAVKEGCMPWEDIKPIQLR